MQSTWTNELHVYHCESRVLKIAHPVRLSCLESDVIGRRGFILQILDSPKHGFSAPETKRSIVAEIKVITSSFQSYMYK